MDTLESTPPRQFLSDEAMIALARQHVSAELSRDWAGVAGTMSEGDGYLKFGSTIVRGRKSIAAWYRLAFAGLSDGRFEEDTIFCIGNRVYARGAITGRHTGFSLGLPPTGRSLRLPVFAVFEVAADGTFAFEEGYFDMLSALHEFGFKFHPMNPINTLLVYAELVAHPITLLRVLGYAMGRLVGRK